MPKKKKVESRQIIIALLFIVLVGCTLWVLKSSTLELRTSGKALLMSDAEQMEYVLCGQEKTLRRDFTSPSRIEVPLSIPILESDTRETILRRCNEQVRNPLALPAELVAECMKFKPKFRCLRPGSCAAGTSCTENPVKASCDAELSQALLLRGRPKITCTHFEEGMRPGQITCLCNIEDAARVKIKGTYKISCSQCRQSSAEASLR